MYQIALSPAEIADKISQAVNDYKEFVVNTDWINVATVVIAGVGIVLGVLVVLIGVFSGFGSLVSGLENFSKKRKARKAAKKAAKKASEGGESFVTVEAPAYEIKKPAPVPAPVVEQGISGEIVAAITAAITAGEGTNQFVIRSVRRKEAGSRNPWARAAVSDNTRSF